MRCVLPPRFLKLIRKSAGRRDMILTLTPLVQDSDPAKTLSIRYPKCIHQVVWLSCEIQRNVLA